MLSRRLCFAALIASSSAFADEPSTALERVEVVGSRISRIHAETALPVQVIRREEIERSGVQSAEELLARVPANVGAWVDAFNIGSDGKPGFSGASLRGLGPNATLVLLNGRRLANYAFSDQDYGVDLHAIPLAAIDRVEILKDGASALYGSDAIAGVINFVTRKDFEGVHATGYAGTSEAGGGSQLRGVLSLGSGDAGRDGYNVFTVLDLRRDNSLAARDRAFSSTTYRPAGGLDRTSNNTFPGNIAVGGGRFVNPAAPACTETTVFTRGGCAYDYARQIDDVAPLSQASILARGVLRTSANHELFGELLFEQHSATYKIAATPVSFVTTNGIVEIDVPTTSPYYPSGLGLTGDIHDVRYRTVELGPRTSSSRSDNARAVVGTRGVLGGWDYDAAISLAASRADYGLVSGFVDSLAVQSAFDSGFVNPFGASGPAGNALLAAAQVTGNIRSATGKTRTVDAHASREVVQLPAGPLAVAIGAEWRRETLTDVSSPISASVAGTSLNPPKSGARDVFAVFAETTMPVLRGLEAQLAVRGDHYSDFGTSWNPKAALRWQPTKTFLARASAGRGFRAPSLPELYTARGHALVEVDVPGGDAARCPVTHLDSDCLPVVSLGFGGNPQLQPVRSTQASVGFVVEPTASWNVTVDYWRIELRDNIASNDPFNILTHLAAYEAKNVVRGPVDPAFPNLPGPIVGIDTFNENLNRVRTAGADVGVSYRSPTATFGRLGARLEGTLITEWRETFAGVTTSSSLGAFAGGYVLPRWKHQLAVDWERGPYVATVGHAYRSGYTDQQPLPDGSSRRVASYLVWDAQLAYTASKDASIRFGAKNLFDRDPPFSNQLVFIQPGYDPGYADPRGRFWYVSCSLRFR